MIFSEQCSLRHRRPRKEKGICHRNEHLGQKDQTNEKRKMIDTINQWSLTNCSMMSWEELILNQSRWEKGKLPLQSVNQSVRRGRRRNEMFDRVRWRHRDSRTKYFIIPFQLLFKLIRNGLGTVTSKVISKILVAESLSRLRKVSFLFKH